MSKVVGIGRWKEIQCGDSIKRRKDYLTLLVHGLIENFGTFFIKVRAYEEKVRYSKENLIQNKFDINRETLHVFNV